MIFYVIKLLDYWNVDAPQLEVSEELGIAQSVISRLWQRFQDDGNVSRCYITGCPRVTTPNEDLYIWQLLPKEKKDHSIRPVSSDLFSYRAPGIRYHQENTIERHRYGAAGWLVWGGIILGSRTDLHIHSVTMTGHIYRDVILEQHVRLFLGAMGAEFLFIDDNASSTCKHCRRLPSIGGYHPFGLASILTGHESNRASVGYAWPTNFSPSTPSHLSTGTSEGIA
ncbi:nibrin [Trichonephila clavipes]|nr:nibrin [Trichonephila clavipes]